MQNLPDLPGTCVLHCTLATLSDPGGTHSLSRFRVECCCLLHMRLHRLPHFILTRLNHFTLSHCGSHTPMPTLKPNLATSAPRLGTGCSLGFTGFGLSPNCLTHAELAHPMPNCIIFGWSSPAKLLTKKRTAWGFGLPCGAFPWVVQYVSPSLTFRAYLIFLIEVFAENQL